MLDYKNEDGHFTIVREITNSESHSMKREQYEFLTLESLIEGFEKMYKEDKLIYESIRTRCLGPKRNIFFDETVNTYTYTFNVQYVSVYVHIEGLEDVAKAIYGEAVDNI